MTTAMRNAVIFRIRPLQLCHCKDHLFIHPEQGTRLPWSHSETASYSILTVKWRTLVRSQTRTCVCWLDWLMTDIYVSWIHHVCIDIFFVLIFIGCEMAPATASMCWSNLIYVHIETFWFTNVQSDPVWQWCYYFYTVCEIVAVFLRTNKYYHQRTICRIKNVVHVIHWRDNYIVSVFFCFFYTTTYHLPTSENKNGSLFMATLKHFART